MRRWVGGGDSSSGEGGLHRQLLGRGDFLHIKFVTKCFPLRQQYYRSYTVDITNFYTRTSCSCVKSRSMTDASSDVIVRVLMLL